MEESTNLCVEVSMDACVCVCVRVCVRVCVCVCVCERERERAAFPSIFDHICTEIGRRYGYMRTFLKIWTKSFQKVQKS